MYKFILGLFIGLWLMYGICAWGIVGPYKRTIEKQRLLIEELKQDYYPPRPPGGQLELKKEMRTEEKPSPTNKAN